MFLVSNPQSHWCQQDLLDLALFEVVHIDMDAICARVSFRLGASSGKQHTFSQHAGGHDDCSLNWRKLKKSISTEPTVRMA